MTEPDDVTELSTRAKHAGADDDVTSLSRRTVAADEAAALASESAAATEDGFRADDEDITRLTDRSHSASQDTADSTRLSQRSAPPLLAPTTRRRAPLPPGSIGGAAAERGVFGQPADEYSVREAPETSPPPLAPVAVPIPLDTGTPEPLQVHRRREAARHRRLITAVIVVAATAALMTLAVIAILALVNGD